MLPAAGLTTGFELDQYVVDEDANFAEICVISTGSLEEISEILLEITTQAITASSKLLV